MGPKETPFNQDSYFCGPASIDDLNKGVYTTPYDTGFIGSESNAKLTTYYKGKGETKYRLVSTDKTHVGELMLSKLADAKCNKPTVSGGGYSSICKENRARLYSRPGTFLEVDESGKAFDFTVSGPNKEGFIELGVSHKAKIKPLGVGSAKKVKWSITALAMANNGTILGRIDTIKGEYDVAKGPSRENIMELQFGAATWKKSEVLSLFKKTDSVKFLFAAVPDQGEPMTGFKFATYRAKPLTLECGSKEQKVGEIKCTVIASSRLPTSLTNVTVTLEVTGQGVQEEQKSLSQGVSGKAVNADQAAFLEEDAKPRTADGSSGSATMGKGAVRFENLVAKTKVAGPAIVIATLTSTELVANKGFYSVTLTA